jgi:murein DD-endopeptidase MepM/ murein hydrolase activator NlpD
MIQKKVTFLILDEFGSPVRKYSLKKGLIWIFLLVCLSLSVALGFGFQNYRRLQGDHGQIQGLKQDIVHQQKKIESQRLQIQTLAEKINNLKSNLVALNDFEKKIRIIANLDQKEDEDHLFGMGGSIPEDIDPNIPLKKDHDALLRIMHEQVDQVADASVIQEKNFSSLIKKLEAKRNFLAATPSIRPTSGWITSNFGYRTSPFTGRRELHKGLDIAAPNGTPIIAPADGIITYAGRKGSFGNMITIDHGYGMQTRYGHISKLLKKKGERVERGDVVALVGSTGRSTGPHLHYEVCINGVQVNPKKYILN